MNTVLQLLSQFSAIKSGEDIRKDSRGRKDELHSSSSTNSSDEFSPLLNPSDSSSSSDSTSCDGASSLSKLSTEVSRNTTTPKNPTKCDHANRLSPTKTLTDDEVNQRMADDKIAEQPFYKDGNNDVKDVVLFLYRIGYAYGTGMASNERILKIKKLVEESNGNLKRLCSMAFQDVPEQKVFRENAKESFLNLAVTVDLFFSDETAFGEFSGQKFVRFQRGANQTCWLCAACTWNSLLMRMKVDTTPDDYIVNLPQRIRRYITSSKPEKRDEIIERRVANPGDYVHKFACSLFNGNHNWLKCEKSNLFALRFNYERHGPGLVSNFLLTKNFIDAAQKRKPTERNAYGYWEFNHINDKGDFITLDATEREEIRKKQLERKVQLQLKQEQERDEVNQKGAQTPSNANKSTKAQQRQPSTGEKSIMEERHAMVLLGGRTINEKHMFMCLNSWPAMPLVLVSQDYLEACEAIVYFRENVTEEDCSEYEGKKNHIAFDAWSPFGDEKYDGSSENLLNTVSILFDDEIQEGDHFGNIDVAAPPISSDDEDY